MRFCKSMSSRYALTLLLMKKLSWSLIQSLKTKARMPAVSSKKKIKPRNTENWRAQGKRGNTQKINNGCHFSDGKVMISRLREHSHLLCKRHHEESWCNVPVQVWLWGWSWFAEWEHGSENRSPRGTVISSFYSKCRKRGESATDKCTKATLAPHSDAWLTAANGHQLR